MTILAGVILTAIKALLKPMAAETSVTLWLIREINSRYAISNKEVLSRINFVLYHGVNINVAHINPEILNRKLYVSYQKACVNIIQCKMRPVLFILKILAI